MHAKVQGVSFIVFNFSSTSSSTSSFSTTISALSSISTAKPFAPSTANLFRQGEQECKGSFYYCSIPPQYSSTVFPLIFGRVNNAQKMMKKNPTRWRKRDKVASFNFGLSPCELCRT